MEEQWWKKAVVYQIYPRSFMDSNGDGIGDLRGILSRLDYLKELGIDVIWLSPIYQSPNDDNGYDISHYEKIMMDFGTMDDFDALLAGAHDRGLKILMDLVVNHTSDEHEWFVQSRSSRDNPYQDFYIWRDKPNNWESAFSGSAWEYNEATKQYYLHIFSKKQPDLNWENPQVRTSVYKMMRFWLDKGVDGFRMDVINFISKDPRLPDAPNPTGQKYVWGGQYFMNGPRIHEFLHEMNQEVLSQNDIMTVGEMPGVTTEEAVLYTGDDRHELNMVFQFEHMDLDSGPQGKWDLKPWDLKDLKQVMSKWQTELHGVGWNSLYLNNHDQPRMVSRFGDDGAFRVVSAKMLGTFLHMMQGTPFIYQGEELGMTNVRFPSIDDYQDIEIRNMWQDKVVSGGADPERVMQSIYVKGRDNARTPMQWTSGPNAGFTSGTPWLQINPNYREINAGQAVADEDSVFHYYQKLIGLRKRYPVIVDGKYELILADDEEIYTYTRTTERELLLVVLNFFSGSPEFHLPQNIRYRNAKFLLGNYPVDESDAIESFKLRPYEARVYLLTP